MAERWFLKCGEEESGPLTVAQIRRLVAENRIGPGDHLRKESGQQWIAANRLNGLMRTAAPAHEDEAEDFFVHVGKRILRFVGALMIAIGTLVKQPIERWRQHRAKASREAETRAVQKAQSAKIQADISLDEKWRERRAQTNQLAAASPPLPTRTDQGSQVRCPRCRSNQLSANKQGFGAGKGAVGCLLVGPVGLAGGLIGSNKIKITCLNCGEVFDPGQGG